MHARMTPESAPSVDERRREASRILLSEPASLPGGRAADTCAAGAGASSRTWRTDGSGRAAFATARSASGPSAGANGATLEDALDSAAGVSCVGPRSRGLTDIARPPKPPSQRGLVCCRAAPSRGLFAPLPAALPVGAAPKAAELKRSPKPKAAGELAPNPAERPDREPGNGGKANGGGGETALLLLSVDCTRRCMDERGGSLALASSDPARKLPAPNQPTPAAAEARPLLGVADSARRASAASSEEAPSQSDWLISSPAAMRSSHSSSACKDAKRATQTRQHRTATGQQSQTQEKEPHSELHAC